MILTTHALTGAVIGKNIENPFLIIILSLIIHYLMDTLKHGEYLDRNSTTKETFWKVFLDLSIGLSVIALILYYNLNTFNIFNILLGAFFSMFPDLLTFLYWKVNIKFLEKIFKFHAWMHKFPPFSPERKWNLKNSVNDLAIIIISIVLLLF